MRNILVLFLAICLLSMSQERPDRQHYTLAFDVSPFAMNGYSIKASCIPANRQKMEFHAELFALNYPKLLIGQHPSNNPDELKVEVNYAFAIYADRKLTAQKNALYAGVGGVYLDERAIGLNATDNYNLIEFLARLHYKHYWPNSNFYFNPYLAFAYRSKMDTTGSAASGYTLVKFISLASVYIGYEF